MSKDRKIKEAKQAKKIILDYILMSFFHYKVCEGCDSIIFFSKVFCPKCNAYRFDDSPERVRSQVKKARRTKDVYFDI